jgi:hypothetical protein
MHRGYIKLWRKTLDSDVWDNPHVFRIWCWCLMKATYKPIIQMVGYQSIPLLPGQFIFGRKKCSSETKVSEKQVRTCLQALKTANRIAIKTASKFSVVSIINWDDYQSQEDTMGHQNGQQKGHEGASKGPAKGHKQEVKNKRKEIIYTEDFEIFWKEYPKHVKKIVAFSEWEKIDTSNGTIQKIMNGLKDWKNSQQWNDSDGKYIPDPERFLKNRRWEDEIKKINVQQQSLMPRN